MRNIVNRGFTPRQIARWKSRAKEIVAESMQALDTSNEFEVVQQLSIPLPVTIIAELLGIEKERHQDFKRWSNKIIDLATGPRRGNPFQAETVDAFLELSEYLGQVTRARKKNPGDDLVSTIVSSRPGETALSTQETVNFVTLLLVAGNETTTNLIGNAVNALLDHPDQMQIAAKEPSRIPDVIEEALRYDAPIQLLFREAVRDTQIAGTPIPKGNGCLATARVCEPRRGGALRTLTSSTSCANHRVIWVSGLAHTFAWELPWHVPKRARPLEALLPRASIS